MSLVDQANELLSRWYLSGGVVLHHVADFLYDCACLAYKVKARPSAKILDRYLDIYAEKCGIKDRKAAATDMRRRWLIEGFAPDEYFIYRLYDGDIKKRKELISDVYRLKAASILNSRKNAKIMKHKYQAYQIFGDLYKREVIKAEDIDERFLQEHPRFLIKNEAGSRGVNVTFRTVDDPSTYSKTIAEISQLKDCICEEAIEQDERMAAFHPQSINTIRVRVLKNIEGEPVIWNCTLRTGAGDSIVDNSFAGGPYALVDVDTGVVMTDGVTERCDVYECHPDTGVRFKGFVVPEWQQLKDLACLAVKRLDRLGFIGWDIALSKKGWVIIEGNSFSQVVNLGGSYMPYKKEMWDIVFNRKK